MPEMKRVTQSEWMDALQEGDIGISQGRSLSSKIQNLFRKRRSGPEVDMHASHTFYIKVPPSISEADGKIVNGANVIDRYFNGNHRVWVFRHHAVTSAAIKRMRAYARGAEEAGGTYSWGLIWQYARNFFTGKTMKDKRGVVCSEYTSRLIVTGELKPFLDMEPHKITPSIKLSWLSKSAPVWPLMAYFDRGEFYLPVTAEA